MSEQPWKSVETRVYTGDGGFDIRNLPKAEERAALIVKAVNNHDALVKALEEARVALVKIRAASIAGCEEGYGKPEKWADNLFRSHGDVAQALKTIDAALPHSNCNVGRTGESR